VMGETRLDKSSRRKMISCDASCSAMYISKHAFTHTDLVCSRIQYKYDPYSTPTTRARHSRSYDYMLFTPPQGIVLRVLFGAHHSLMSSLTQATQPDSPRLNILYCIFEFCHRVSVCTLCFRPFIRDNVACCITLVQEPLRKYILGPSCIKVTRRSWCIFTVIY
jgi:hypothetical protein